MFNKFEGYSPVTCGEVLEILEHIPKEYYDKLPREIINYFNQNADDPSKRKFVYNVALPIEEQEISLESREVIRFLMKFFFSNEG